MSPKSRGRSFFAFFAVLLVAAGFSKSIAATATGTPLLVGGFVVAIAVTDPGSGYTEAPAVYIRGGGGSGALAVAKVADGMVTGITVINAGFGYTSLPEVRIAPPGGFPFRLRIEPSHVRLRLRVVLGHKYQVETSNDQIVWSPLGQPVIADDEQLTIEVPIEEVGRFRRIYRVY